MGRHRAPETADDARDRCTPILRMPPVRPMPKIEKQVPGLLFPIVDDLSMIAADDQMLDSIAAGRADFGDLFATTPALVSGHPHPAQSAVGALEPLLVTWRCEVIEAPMPEIPRPPVRIRPMHAPADKAGRRSIRPMIAAVAAICALLVGSTAVGARSARPGDTLWALTQVLYSSHAKSVVAQQGADRSLKKAVVLLSQGDAPKALVALTSASGQLERVELGMDRENLQTRLDTLWVKAQSETEAASPSSSPDGLGKPAYVAVVPGLVGSTVLTPTSKPTTAGPTSGRTTGVGPAPVTLGNPTVPVILVGPPTGRTVPVRISTVPVAPVTVAPPKTSPPSIPPPTTAPVTTRQPPSTSETTPTSPAPVTPPPEVVTTTPESTDPAASGGEPTSTDVSTTSETPPATDADTPTDVPEGNGPAAAQPTDVSE